MVTKEYIVDEHAKKGLGDSNRKGEKNLGKDEGPIGVIDMVHGVTNSAEVTTQLVRT